ncbi:MAG TPA: TetR/AcrR family transcriptional regulator [Pilimelia sp.]|nr:TetR/AcrR family transcriptional regulator [Pilimelia sp.]
MATKRRRLSREDWVIAATAALGAGGLAAVAVEPLAAGLGATKGSFYAHFAHRAELVAAVLDRWEEQATEARLAALDALPDPRERLRTLLVRAVMDAGKDPVEISLWAAADNPLVTPVLRRVMSRRIGYLAGLFGALGFGRAEARQRATLGYTAYLGHCQFAARLPGTLPVRGDTDGYVELVLDLLVAPRRVADERP